MRRVLLIATAAVAVGLGACSSTSRMTNRYDDQPPAGSVVRTAHQSTSPGANPVRLSAFDLKKDCNL